MLLRQMGDLCAVSAVGPVGVWTDIGVMACARACSAELLARVVRVAVVYSTAKDDRSKVRIATAARPLMRAMKILNLGTSSFRMSSSVLVSGSLL